MALDRFLGVEILWLVLLTMSQPAQPKYTIIDLGTLGGPTDTSTRGNTLNNSGQVVGESYINGNTAYHAFLYSNGIMTDLGTLDGSYSIGNGINDSGQVVGYSFNSGQEGHGFLYSGGSMAALGTLGGTASLAISINNSGQIVGFANTPANITTHAFLYSDGIMKDLGTLGGSTSRMRKFEVFSRGCFFRSAFRVI